MSKEDMPGSTEKSNETDVLGGKVLMFPAWRTRQPAMPKPGNDLPQMRRNLARSFVDMLALIDAAIAAGLEMDG